LGQTGCGKTTLIANLAKQRERFIIFDTKEDFPADFFVGAAEVDSVQKFVEQLNRGSVWIIVQLWKVEDPEEFLNRCCACIMRWHTLNLGKVETTIVLDEANNFVHVNHCDPELRNIIQRGRSIGLRKIFGAQWFGTIPTWMRDSFTEIYTFKHVDEVGVERLESFGFDPEQVKTLPEYNCLYAAKGQVEQLELIARKKQ
jgi:hypothetical protein